MTSERRRLVGRVVSDKMEKTVVVAIERRKMHRVYKKIIQLTKKVYAHDETNEIEVGSLVQVVESKPLSKSKRWVVEKVLETPAGKVLQPITGAVVIEPEPEATGAVGVEQEPEAPQVEESQS